MSNILAFIIIYFVVFTGLMIYFIKTAPFGYQDKDGFHKIEETKK